MGDELMIEGPSWPGVRIGFSTRQGGISAAPFDTMNLGQHVGDDPSAVSHNRAQVVAWCGGEPVWLEQVHGVAVWHADQQRFDIDPGTPSNGHVAPAPDTGASSLRGDSPAQNAGSLAPRGRLLAPIADAAVTCAPAQVLAIMVADCLPVALARDDGAVIGVAHAGWRGLAAGVLERTLQAMQDRVGGADGGWRAWIGPSIGPRAFEVGDDVRSAFVTGDAGAADCFTPGLQPGKWWGDLPALARRRLHQAGVQSVELSGCCTFSAPQTFYSYRRDGQCGRMALLAWRDVGSLPN